MALQFANRTEPTALPVAANGPITLTALNIIAAMSALVIPRRPLIIYRLPVQFTLQVPSPPPMSTPATSNPPAQSMLMVRFTPMVGPFAMQAATTVRQAAVNGPMTLTAFTIMAAMSALEKRIHKAV